MQRDILTVQTFLKIVLKHFRGVLARVSHVMFFSDGAVSQYKNHKNFRNLCWHEHDYVA